MKNLSTKGSNKMKKEVNQNRLNGKDLMNVGIFTAINVILGVVVAVAIGLTPIGFMMIPFVAAIIMGIPMMLYFTKIKKFGMILIFELVNGIVLLLTGMGPCNWSDCGIYYQIRRLSKCEACRFWICSFDAHLMRQLYPLAECQCRMAQ